MKSKSKLKSTARKHRDVLIIGIAIVAAIIFFGPVQNYYLTVNNVAGLNVSPTSGAPPLFVTATCSTGSTFPTNDPPYSFAISWGDGSQPSYYDTSQTYYQAQHIYSSVGNYNIACAVSDSNLDAAQSPVIVVVVAYITTTTITSTGQTTQTSYSTSTSTSSSSSNGGGFSLTSIEAWFGGSTNLAGVAIPNWLIVLIAIGIAIAV